MVSLVPVNRAVLSALLGFSPIFPWKMFMKTMLQNTVSPSQAKKKKKGKSLRNRRGKQEEERKRKCLG